MRKIERRLLTYVGKEQTHCGHQELVDEAERFRWRFLEFVESELRKAAEKGAVE